jgi:aerobic-type carbon monoxide dehydrogenase small subunit (CoxS/CutS family)
MASLSLTVNGKPRRVDTPSDETLLIVLRDRL